MPLSDTPGGKTKQMLAIIYILALTVYVIVDKSLPSRRSYANADAARVAVVEAELKGLKDTVTTYRPENREEHAAINRKLDSIVIEIKK